MMHESFWTFLGFNLWYAKDLLKIRKELLHEKEILSESECQGSQAAFSSNRY